MWEEEVLSDLGHMTGQGGLVWRPCRNQGVGTMRVLSWKYDLAKLHLKCHLNYSIIFAEISFSPETSNWSYMSLTQMGHLDIQISKSHLGYGDMDVWHSNTGSNIHLRNC